MRYQDRERRRVREKGDRQCNRKAGRARGHEGEREKERKREKEGFYFLIILLFLSLNFFFFFLSERMKAILSVCGYFFEKLLMSAAMFLGLG